MLKKHLGRIQDVFSQYEGAYRQSAVKVHKGCGCRRTRSVFVGDIHEEQANGSSREIAQY